MPCHRCGPIRWALPGEARIIVNRAAGRFGATIGNRHYDHLPDIVVVGPTSRLRTSWNEGPSLVEIPLSALDWCRLTGTPADTIADRIVTPGQVGLTALADDLALAVGAGHDGGALASTIRAIIARHGRYDPRHTAPHVEALMAIVRDARIVDASIVADRIGVAPHALRRVALRQFGFPVKTILMRRRFLIALDHFYATDMDMAAAVSRGYFDPSHFLRDAKRFLGMTPRRFRMTSLSR